MSGQSLAETNINKTETKDRTVILSAISASTHVIESGPKPQAKPKKKMSVQSLAETNINQTETKDRTVMSSATSASTYVTSSDAMDSMNPHSEPTTATAQTHPSVEIVDLQADDFKCVICQHLAQQPVVTSCSHIFCNDCLCKWSKTSIPHSRLPPMNDTVFTHCPTCKRVIRMNECKPPDGISMRLMKRVRVKCCYAPACTWQGEYGNLASHLTTGCVACPECAVVLTSIEERETHMKTCVKCLTLCFVCQQWMPKRQTADKHQCTFPCRVKGCKTRLGFDHQDEERKHLATAHTTSEIAELVLSRDACITTHPFCTNVRCVCGKRMMYMKQDVCRDWDTKVTCVDCQESIPLKNDYLMCPTDKTSHSKYGSGYLCVTCAKQPIIRGYWLHARVKPYPGSPFAYQAEGSTGTIVQPPGNIIRERSIYVRWDKDKHENWYRIGWNNRTGADLVLDTDDKASLRMVYSNNDTVNLMYRSEASKDGPIVRPRVAIDGPSGEWIFLSGTSMSLDRNPSGIDYYTYVPELHFDTPRPYPTLASSSFSVSSSSTASASSLSARVGLPASSTVYRKYATFEKRSEAGLVLDWNVFPPDTASQVFVMWPSTNVPVMESIVDLTHEKPKAQKTGKRSKSPKKAKRKQTRQMSPFRSRSRSRSATRHDIQRSRISSNRSPSTPRIHSPSSPSYSLSSSSPPPSGPSTPPRSTSPIGLIEISPQRITASRPDDLKSLSGLDQTDYAMRVATSTISASDTLSATSYLQLPTRRQLLNLLASHPEYSIASSSSSSSTSSSSNTHGY